MRISTNYKQDEEFKKEFVQQLGDAAWVVQYVQDNFNPDDVFDYYQLKSWAEENGFEQVK